jgi:hypothetical protein
MMRVMSTNADWMAARTTHGEYMGGKESAEHYVWRGLFRRAVAKSGKYYVGVSVCERWRSFPNFLADMGRRPTSQHQIDRIDPHGNYEPSNCRWATRSDQQKNKRSTKRWERDGVIRTASEWADHLGISRALASYRMKHWGTFEKGKEWRLQNQK